MKKFLEAAWIFALLAAGMVILVAELSDVQVSWEANPEASLSIDDGRRVVGYVGYWEVIGSGRLGVTNVVGTNFNLVAQPGQQLRIGVSAYNAFGIEGPIVWTNYAVPGEFTITNVISYALAIQGPWHPMGTTVTHHVQWQGSNVFFRSRLEVGK
jgi:hypothetical protein